MDQQQLLTTARLTGLWYLLLAVSGILGFMVFHPQVYITNDAEKTLSNLIKNASVARTRLLFELVIIVSQALAAVWFFHFGYIMRIHRRKAHGCNTFVLCIGIIHDNYFICLYYD